MKKTLLWIVVGCSVAVVLVMIGRMRVSSLNISPSLGLLNNHPKIGFVIALSGANASAGKPIANTVEMLRRKYPNVEFCIEDSKSTASSGVQAAKKLLDVENVDLLYCDLSNVTASLVPLTEKRKKILVATVFMQDFITLGKYTVRNFMTIESQATIALKTLVKDNPMIKTAALAVSNDEVGRASIEGFRNAIAQTGHTLKDTYLFSTADIRNVAATAALTSADFMYVSSFSATLGQFIKELKSSGYKGRIVTSTAITFPFIRNAAGNAVEGTLHTDFPKTEAYYALKKNYEEEFGDTPPLTVFLCYDGMSILLEAIVNQKPETNDELLSMLEGSVYDGAYGKLRFVGREIIYPLVTSVEE